MAGKYVFSGFRENMFWQENIFCGFHENQFWREMHFDEKTHFLVLAEKHLPAENTFCGFGVKTCFLCFGGKCVLGFFHENTFLQF